MNLKDIVPQTTSFYLRLIDKTFTMTPLTLGHELEFAEKIGDNWGEKLFSEFNFSDIVFVVYRLLDDESRRFLVKQEVTSCDDDGNEIDITIGGVNLLKRIISGNSEKESIVRALIENIGINSPKNDEEDSKKKVNP